MRNLKNILIALLISSQAFAGLPPTTVKGQLDSSPSVTFNIQVPHSQATRINGTTALLETGNKNTLINPNASGGTAGYSASGGSFTTGGSGNATYFSFDSGSAGEVVSSGYQTITSGDPWSGRNGIVSADFKCASGTCTHKLQVYDGTNILAEKSIVSSTSQFIRTSLNFIYPASGTVRWQVASVASNEPAVYWRDGFRGLAEGFNVADISQASLFGAGVWAATSNCEWSVTSSSFSSFSADTDCPNPSTKGVAVAAGTKIPALHFSSLPEGEYLIVAQGKFLTNGGNQTNRAWRFTDGTNVSTPNVFDNSVSASFGSISGHLSVGAALSNVDLQVQAKFPSTDSGRINAEVEDFAIYVYRFPTASQQAYKPDQTPASWSGYHDGDCDWSGTSSTYTDPAPDSTCTFTQNQSRNFSVSSYASGGDNLPGIVFSPPKTGRYLICVSGNQYDSSSSAIYSLQLTDGTNQISTYSMNQPNVANFATGYSTCGIWDASSISSATIKLQYKTNNGTYHIGGQGAGYHAVEWMITQIDAANSTPYLVGTVTSNTLGQERIERARITNGGSCAVSSQSGTWISSISRPGSGQCTLTIAAGIFSGSPECQCSAGNTSFSCVPDLSTTSATNVAIITRNSGTLADTDISISCVGPR
jgi:hypothetical protein